MDTTTNLLLGILGIVGFFSVILLALLVLIIVAMWKINTKAGKPGWAAIVPFYNCYVTGKIANSDDRLTIAMLAVRVLSTLIGLRFIDDISSTLTTVSSICSIAFFVLWVITMLHLAAAFGESTGFAIGMILLPFVFLPILAFGDYRYQCPQPRIPYGAKPSDPFDSMK